MPKVHILQGNEAGAIVEMPLAEAQAGYCTGFLELYVEPEKPKAKILKVKPEAKVKGEKKGA